MAIMAATASLPETQHVVEPGKKKQRNRDVRKYVYGRGLETTETCDTLPTACKTFLMIRTSQRPTRARMAALAERKRSRLGASSFSFPAKLFCASHRNQKLKMGISFFLSFAKGWFLSVISFRPSLDFAESLVPGHFRRPGKRIARNPFLGDSWLVLGIETSVMKKPQARLLQTATKVDLQLSL